MVTKIQDKSIFSYVLIMLSAAVLSMNYYIFIIPNSFAPAGLNGIATMVQYKFGFSIGYMSLLINIPLCLTAYFVVDKVFAVRTLLFSGVYSVLIILLQNSGLERIKSKKVHSRNYAPKTQFDPLLRHSFLQRYIKSKHTFLS